MIHELAKVQVSEASYLMLDWTLAKLLALVPELMEDQGKPFLLVENFDIGVSIPYRGPFSPCTNPIFGAMLADRYKLSSGAWNAYNAYCSAPVTPLTEWWAMSYDGTLLTHGRNRLHAQALNIIVAEYGYEIEVPIGLVQS